MFQEKIISHYPKIIFQDDNEDQISFIFSRPNDTVLFIIIIDLYINIVILYPLDYKNKTEWISHSIQYKYIILFVHISSYDKRLLLITYTDNIIDFCYMKHQFMINIFFNVFQTSNKFIFSFIK